MKSIAFYFPGFLILLLASSCQKDCTKDRHNYGFENNKSIQINEINNGEHPPVLSTQITEGENIVFTYQFDAAQCESIFDDEYSEFIYFEVDATIDQFSLKDSALTNIKLIYKRSGAWVNEQAQVVIGTINGVKNNTESWDIDAEFVLPLSTDLSSNASEMHASFSRK